MKNFDEKEKQIQEICDKILNSDVLNSDCFYNEVKIACYDIIKIVREAYYEGHYDGVKRLSEIHAKNQELISNLFKN